MVSLLDLGYNKKASRMKTKLSSNSDFVSCRESTVMIGYALSLLWGMCTSLANPILYSLLNENFRSAVRDRLNATAAGCVVVRAVGRTYSAR